MKIYGIHAVLALLENHPENVYQLFIQQGRADLRLQKLIALAEHHGIKVQQLAKSKLGKGSHQGVVAEVADAATYSEADLPLLLDNLKEPPFLLILDQIQDPHNLGACLRTANAAGVHAVIAPKDKSVGLTATVRKVACGAAETTPFIQVTNLARSLRQLKERGIWLYGTDAEAKISIFKVKFSAAVAIILGAEATGLRNLTSKECDVLVSIPMRGSVSSLNVSVAAGICLFEVLRQIAAA